VIQKQTKKNAGSDPNAKNRQSSLMEMVQYGADKVFRSKNAQVTEEDIDAILDNCKGDTERVRAEWEKKSKKKFEELTLEFNYQSFEGEDFTEARKLKRTQQLEEQRQQLLAVMAAEGDAPMRSTRLSTQIGSRVGAQRKNYNEDAYFRQKLSEARNTLQSNQLAAKYNPNGLTQPSRLPDIRYWQLFDSKALYQIHATEWEWFNRWRNHEEYNENECGEQGLSDEERAQKQSLLDAGFAQITYRDFACFVRCCIKFGKDAVDAIAAHMAAECVDIDGQSDSEIELAQSQMKDLVRRYHSAFFERGPAVSELSSALERIAESEKRWVLRRERQRLSSARAEERAAKKLVWEQKRREAEERKVAKQQMQRERAAEAEAKLKQILSVRVAKWTQSLSVGEGVGEGVPVRVYKEMQLPDAKGRENGFTKAMDRFLILTTHKMGYGEWNKVRARLWAHPMLRMNFFVRTLSTAQIKGRVDALIRACAGSKAMQKNVLKRDRAETPVIGANGLVKQMDDISIKERKAAPPSKKQKV